MSTLYPKSIQIHPMKYAKEPSSEKVEELLSSNDFVGQEKKDGASYTLEKIDKDHIYLFGRTVSKKTGELSEKSANVPHIITWAKNNLPDGTVLLGEIYYPGGESKDVTKIMGAKPEKARKRQVETQDYGGLIHYWVFDILYYSGRNLMEDGFQERYDRYLKYELGDKFWDVIELAPVYEDNFEQHLHNIFAAGGEGMVFKRKDSKYYPDKRPTSQYYFKFKQHIDSIDLVCMGLLDPEERYTGKEIEHWGYWQERTEYNSDGSYDYVKWPAGECAYKDYKANPNFYMPITKAYYYGWKNAMQLGAYDDDGNLIEVCRVASGIDDIQRQDMAIHPENYIGNVVEIECMSINKKDMTVRHPVFIRVRDDKPASDCKIKEIFE